jgi:hypothetical protein
VTDLFAALVHKAVLAIIFRRSFATCCSVAGDGWRGRSGALHDRRLRGARDAYFRQQVRAEILLGRQWG